VRHWLDEHAVRLCDRLSRPVDKSVDGILEKPWIAWLWTTFTDWSFFVHKIKARKNSQLHKDENGSTNSTVPGPGNPSVVHKHLSERA
jgi:hypothetical protein